MRYIGVLFPPDCKRTNDDFVIGKSLDSNKAIFSIVGACKNYEWYFIDV
jgi:hypothetical protein